MVVNFGSLKFGDVESSEYGIYITGSAVFNAPERDVEFVSVPGRNGDVVIDNGKFNNITISYPAGVFGDSPEQFAEKISAFRNALLSQRGYQRLSDTYHPDEYRMGVFVASIEVEPTAKNRAGEFKLEFNCKPQRWLTSGEVAIPVDSGDIIFNQTAFEASPLLEVEGEGSITFNDQTVMLTDMSFGDIVLSREKRDHIGNMYVALPNKKVSQLISIDFNPDLVETDDVITISEVSYWVYTISTDGTFESSAYTTAGTPISDGASWRIPGYIMDDKERTSDYAMAKNVQLTVGTSVNKIMVATITLSGETSGGDTVQTVRTMSLSLVYDGDHTINILGDTELLAVGNSAITEVRLYSGELQVDSSASMLGTPTYIDCDIGEVYRISNGELISLNAAAQLGSDLPVLPVGPTKIEFDDTITDLKIVPRWWQV